MNKLKYLSALFFCYTTLCLIVQEVVDENPGMDPGKFFFVTNTENGDPGRRFPNLDLKFPPEAYPKVLEYFFVCRMYDRTCLIPKTLANFKIDQVALPMHSFGYALPQELEDLLKQALPESMRNDPDVHITAFGNQFLIARGVAFVTEWHCGQVGIVPFSANNTGKTVFPVDGSWGLRPWQVLSNPQASRIIDKNWEVTRVEGFYFKSIHEDERVSADQEKFDPIFDLRESRRNGSPFDLQETWADIQRLRKNANENLFSHVEQGCMMVVEEPTLGGRDDFVYPVYSREGKLVMYIGPNHPLRPFVSQYIGKTDVEVEDIQIAIGEYYESFCNVYREFYHDDYDAQGLSRKEFLLNDGRMMSLGEIDKHRLTQDVFGSQEYLDLIYKAPVDDGRP